MGSGQRQLMPQRHVYLTLQSTSQTPDGGPLGSALPQYRSAPGVNRINPAPQVQGLRRAKSPINGRPVQVTAHIGPG